MELVTISLVKLVLEFHPVKTQSMQEGTESFHHQQHTNSGANEDDDANSKDNHVVVPVQHKMILNKYPSGEEKVDMSLQTDCTLQ